jgi:hypothetical protein
MEIGFVPFPHCTLAAPIESLRGGGALNIPSPPLGWCDILPVRSPVPALWSAEVRFEACCPGGETEVDCRVVMSMGAAPVIVMEGKVSADEDDIVLNRFRYPVCSGIVKEAKKK